MTLEMISDETRTFTAMAQETISGGQFVKGAADDDVVEAGSVDAYAGNEIAVLLCNSELDDQQVVGIALETQTSGNPITISTEGVIIVAAQDAISPGVPVAVTNDDDAFANSVTIVADGSESYMIGRALTGASASGKYLIISLKV